MWEQKDRLFYFIFIFYSPNLSLLPHCAKHFLVITCKYFSSQDFIDLTLGVSGKLTIHYSWDNLVVFKWLNCGEEGSICFKFIIHALRKESGSSKCWEGLETVLGCWFLIKNKIKWSRCPWDKTIELDIWKQWHTLPLNTCNYLGIVAKSL